MRPNPAVDDSARSPLQSGPTGAPLDAPLDALISREQLSLNRIGAILAVLLLLLATTTVVGFVLGIPVVGLLLGVVLVALVVLAALMI